MRQKLSSLLLALLIYTALVFAVGYSYVHYASSHPIPKVPESIAYTIVKENPPKQTKATIKDMLSKEKTVKPLAQKQNKPIPIPTVTVAKKSTPPPKVKKRERLKIKAPKIAPKPQPSVPKENTPTITPTQHSIKEPTPQKPHPKHTAAKTLETAQPPIPLSIPVPTPQEPISQRPEHNSSQKRRLVKPKPQTTTKKKINKKTTRKKSRTKKSPAFRRKKSASKNKRSRTQNRRHSTRGKRTKSTKSSAKKRGFKQSANRFAAQLRARINRHKSYPRLAQRRGIQGVVIVNFTILRGGGVGQIRVSGPSIFHASAKRAVQSAFPLRPSSVPHRLPYTMRFSLRYRNPPIY